MSRLIDADALERWAYGFLGEHLRKQFVSDIRNAPTVDAVAVVRGKWLDQNGGVKCSACTMCSHMRYNYCPSCGAKMEGGE